MKRKYKVFVKAQKFYIEVQSEVSTRIVKCAHRSPKPWRKTVFGTRYFDTLEAAEAWIKQDALKQQPVLTKSY